MFDFCTCFQLFIHSLTEQLYLTVNVILFVVHFRYFYRLSRIIIDNGCEDAGWTSGWPFQAIRKLRASGRPWKPPPVYMEGVVTYGILREAQGWEGGEDGQIHKKLRLWELQDGGQYHWGGGSRLLLGLPPPSPPTFKHYQHQRSGGVRPRAPEIPVGQSQVRPTMHWLYYIRRQAAREGSLLLMVADWFDTKRRQRGGEGRGYHLRTGKGGRGGSGCFARRES